MRGCILTSALEIVADLPEHVQTEFPLFVNIETALEERFAKNPMELDVIVKCLSATIVSGQKLVFRNTESFAFQCSFCRVKD